MKRNLASGILVVLLLGVRSEGEEIAKAEVLTLLRQATAHYEHAFRADFRVLLRCPEIEEIVTERLAFLPVPLQPQVEVLNEGGLQTLRPVLADGTESLQALVEQLCRSSPRFGALLGFAERANAWPSFFRSISETTPLDVIRADEQTLEFEISGLAEPFQQRIVRACRIKIHRPTALFAATTLDFGQHQTLSLIWKFRDVQTPGVKLPLPFPDRMQIRQTAYTGGKERMPEEFVLLFGEYRFLSAAESAARAVARAAAEAKLVKLRADLQRCGLPESKAAQLRFKREGTLELDLRGLPLNDLSFLAGLPLCSLLINTGTVDNVSALTNMPLTRLELIGVPLRDLRPLRGLPLTELRIWNTGVTNLGPVAGMPLEKLDLSNCAVSDLAPLRGMPLRELQASASPVNDLTPLAGMRLTSLQLSYTAVSNLCPLSGMPLKQFRINNTGVTNLAPLAGMPLEKLDISACPVSDLTPLRGLPLRELSAGYTAVTDLSPLAGMKLEWLRVSDRGNRLTDISVLREMTSLKRADFAGARGLLDLHPLEGCVNLEELTLPPDASDIEFLRQLPKLKRLSRQKSKDSWSPDSTVGEFWKQFASDPKLRAGLCLSGASPVEAGQAVLTENNGVLELDLTKVPVTNMTFLAGLPVRRLMLRHTKVTDLSPLRGSQLEYLSLTGSPVSDVAPLAECPRLTWLSLSGTRVVDVQPVLRLKLTHLSINGGLIRDVSPLAACVTLQTIHLPDPATGVEALRQLPHLKRLSSRWDGTKKEPAQTAEEFWKEFDAAKSGGPAGR